MATIGQELAQPAGDVDLARRCAVGDELAADHLLVRHRAAVADSGPSPAFDSVDASGERALAQLRSGSGPDLPFRVIWLALHTQGELPAEEERHYPVWDAFCALPLAEQTALWHREVEGQGATEIAAVLGTSTDEVRRNLVSAYAAVRARVTQAAPPSPSRAMASQLLLLQHSLRDTLAGVVLGPAAGRYLAVRPRAGRRVVIDARPTPRHRASPYVAGLTAAAVGVAASAAAFLGPGQLGTGRLPVTQAAPLEAPVVGAHLQPVAVPPVQTAPRVRTPNAAPAVVGSPSVLSATPTVTTAGDRGSGGPAGGSSTGGSPNGGSPTGGNNNQPDPDPAPADNGPGQGVQHASTQGVSNGTRAHGNGNKKSNGPAKSNGNTKGNSQAKSKGKANGHSKGHSKGKARGHR